MPTTTASSTASKPKRVITKARKIQNREAQRAYRAKRHQGSGALVSLRRFSHPVVRILSATDEPGYDQGHDVGKLDALDISYWNTDLIAPTVPPIGAPTFLTTLSPSTNVLEHDSPPDIGDIAPKDLLDSSLNDPPTASGANSSRTITHTKFQTAAFPSPTESRLTPRRTHLLTACLHNASLLGIAIDDFFTYNCMSLCSPFYRPSSLSTDPKFLLASILIPHHPIFDLIPMPRLRTGAIVLSAAGSNLVNMFELKTDIIEGGLFSRGLVNS
ncbi:hypothetical protein BDW66DRAFT_162430 [Aspergillus desertorum]